MSTESIRLSQGGRGSRRGHRARVPRWTAIWIAVPALILVIVALVVPIVMLLGRSFWDPDFTFEHYLALLGDATAQTVLARTFLVSAAVTVFTLFLAYPYAAAMALASPRVRTLLLAIVMVPFWTSVMARTFAWLVLLQAGGPVDGFLSIFGIDVALTGTATGVVIGMTQVLLPFMVLPLYSVLSQIDLRLVSAAIGMGARPAVAFFRVYLPLSLPGIIAGCVLVFIMCVGFYVTPAILGSPKESMIAQLIDIKISRMLDFAGGGALSLVLIVAILLLLAIATRFVSLGQALGATANQGRVK